MFVDISAALVTPDWQQTVPQGQKELMQYVSYTGPWIVVPFEICLLSSVFDLIK